MYALCEISAFGQHENEGIGNVHLVGHVSIDQIRRRSIQVGSRLRPNGSKSGESCSKSWIDQVHLRQSVAIFATFPSSP